MTAMTTSQGLRSSFDISDWRTSVKARRERVRAIIIRAVVDGEQLEPIIDELKAALGARTMDSSDTNLLNVTVHDIRTVVGGWRKLDEDERRAFLAGKMAPSTAASRIRLQRA